MKFNNCSWFNRISDKCDLKSLLLYFIVAAYPYAVIPGSLPYFYGPRYYALLLSAFCAFFIILFKWAYLNKIAVRISIVFITSVVLSTVVSTEPFQIWHGSSRFTGASTYLFIAIIMLLATQTRYRQSMIKTMVIAAAGVSFIAILQHYGINIVPHEFFRSTSRSYSTLGNPNFLGTYTVFILPAAMMFYLHLNEKRWLIISALIFTAMLASLTRGAWLAFGGVIVLFIYYLYKNSQYRIRFVQLSLVFIATFLILNLTSGDLIFSRVATIPSEIESVNEYISSSVSIRIYVWQETIKVITDNWAFGVGADNLRVSVPEGYVEDKAFNFFLEIWATMGLFTLLAYLALIIYSLKQNRGKGWFGALLTFMIAAYLMQAQFNIDVIMNIPLFWIVLGFCWAEEQEKPLMFFSQKELKNEELRKVNPLSIAVWSSVIIAIFALIGLFYLPRSATIEREGQGIYYGDVRGLMNTFHGQGTWILENGSHYEGDFKHGQFNGYGTLTFTNGAQYSGGFKEGFYHGQGTMIFPDGSILEGLWQMGHLLE